LGELILYDYAKTAGEQGTQTGHSEETHSPEACTRRLARVICPFDRRRLHECDLVPAETLPHDVEPAGEGCVPEGSFAGFGSNGAGERFPGLLNSACALASAVTIAPMVSLERCFGGSIPNRRGPCRSEHRARTFAQP